jgi:hypothetical protein
MSGRTSGKEKRQSPERCPKCGATENLTVAVTCVPDARATWGGRVVWDNDSAAECGVCGFIGKVADFEPKDSYDPEDEADFQDEMEKIARGGEDQYLPIRCQPWGDPIEDETEIKRITDDLRGAGQASGYPQGQDNEPPATAGPEDEEDYTEEEKAALLKYGLDIDAERRREAGFQEEIRRRWEAGIGR